MIAPWGTIVNAMQRKRKRPQLVKIKKLKMCAESAPITAPLLTQQLTSLLSKHTHTPPRTGCLNILSHTDR